MSSPGMTQSMIDDTISSNELALVGQRWRVADNFSHMPMQVPWLTVATNGLADVNWVLGMAIAANRNYVTQGVGVSVGPSEVVTPLASGGILLATRSTSAAQNDSSALLPPTGNTLNSVPVFLNTQAKLSTDREPTWLGAVEHKTSEFTANNLSLLFIAGLVGADGTYDPTQSGFGVNANIGTDAAFFYVQTDASGNNGRWVCCVRRNGSNTDGTFTTNAPAINTRSVLSIVVQTNRRPLFFIDGVQVWEGPALRTGQLVMSSAVVKTLAAANIRRGVRVRQLRYDQLVG